MKLYFAPMEGITSYTYRNMHHKYYGGVDKYYTPFLSPGPQKGLGAKELKDVLPENNEGVPVVPQLMTNRAEDFIRSAEILEGYGYKEINLNLGCPSGTVTAKKKGSGLLFWPEELDRFLDGIFSDPFVAEKKVQVSVKTRIGKNSPEEWPALMDIYNKYPIAELTIHPRIQKDFYNNHPNMEVFREAWGKSKNPVVYNGDIFTAEDLFLFKDAFPDAEAVMLGRGIIRNPLLPRWILEAEKAEKEKTGEEAGFHRELKTEDFFRLREFHDELMERYGEAVSGERNVLFRMKELWAHMILLFPDCGRAEKKLKKSKGVSEYLEAVDEVFDTVLSGQQQKMIQDHEECKM